MGHKRSFKRLGPHRCQQSRWFYHWMRRSVSSLPCPASLACLWQVSIEMVIMSIFPPGSPSMRGLALVTSFTPTYIHTTSLYMSQYVQAFVLALPILGTSLPPFLPGEGLLSLCKFQLKCKTFFHLLFTECLDNINYSLSPIPKAYYSLLCF